MPTARRCPVGAELTSTGAHFRVWAPSAKTVQLVLSDTSKAYVMETEPDGYKSLNVSGLKAGDLYQFKLDDDEYFYPDPASRAQPTGPHGPSMLIDGDAFQWSQHNWVGASLETPVIYEMHIGTFTQAGTYRAAMAELEELAKLGVTIIELMPLSEFDGEFGWGYDGVSLFAPYHAYGTPDDLRLFIDTAHRAGLAVILDVVYNHLGSSGNYLGKFSADYISTHYKSEWGDTFNFDGENSGPVRDFIIQNACYWIREFRFDGFRIDATQQIFDSSGTHIIAKLVSAARAAAPGRTLYIAGENEPQDVKCIQPLERNESGQTGYGLDAIWNDDFHHSAIVAATGRTAAYYSDYIGSPQELISNIKFSFLYQGQYYRWQKQNRGTPTFGIPANKFIHYLQNHDQVANGGRGQRLHQLAHPAFTRALTAALLLGPQTPLLFQGQEFAASTPFLYFADNPEPLAEAVAKGRNEFLHQFPYLAQPEVQPYLSRPDSATTFLQCKLDFTERERNKHVYQLHKDLLHLRKNDEVFSGRQFSHIDGAVLFNQVVVLRLFSREPGADRLVLINFGVDIDLSPIPEPLLAPPSNDDWKLLWSSEAPQYGGHGNTPPLSDNVWQMPALSTVVLTPFLK